MGCKSHYIAGPGGPVQVMFSEGDDDTPCLCTFGTDGRSISPSHVRSMALLGAAAALIRKGRLAAETNGLVVLPAGLPEWLVQRIDRVVGVRPTAALPPGGVPVLTDELLEVVNEFGDDVTRRVDLAGLAGVLLIVGRYPDGADGMASFTAGVKPGTLPALLRELADMADAGEHVRDDDLPTVRKRG
jgi:hypothetical protein